MRVGVLLLVMGCGRIGFDAAADAGNSARCPPAAFLCDDFETGELSRWTVNVEPGTTTMITSSRVHGGTFALESTIPALRDGAFSNVALGSTHDSGILAMRVWQYATPPFGRFDATLLAFHETTRDSAAAVCDENGMWAISEANPNGLYDHRSTERCDPDVWNCVELVYTFAGARVQLYVDDVLVVDDATNNPAPNFNELYVGGARADAAGFHVFVDDVVLATERIGCQ